MYREPKQSDFEICNQCKSRSVEKDCGCGYTHNDIEYIFCCVECCEDHIEDNNLVGIV